MTTNNKSLFLQGIRQYKTGTLQTDKIKVEVKRLHSPIRYEAYYFELRSGTWVKFSTYTTDCSYDLAADISYEINLFNN